MTAQETGILKPKKESQRRILALDGGGIRGLITLGMLERLEAELRSTTKAGDGFRLCDYFDFIGGTSTGAIIAAGLATGMSVAELITFYRDSGALMFTKQALWNRFHALYQADPLRLKLQEVLGPDTTLGSPKLRSLLLIVTRNVTTDSPWPVTNNPLAKYNSRLRADCNLDLPLWRLVRASTAAPVYFPPEVVVIGEHNFVFVDGGVTPYNNPAFLLYRNVTAPSFNLNWETGEDKLLVVSLGTGSRVLAGPDGDHPDRNLFDVARSIASEMMDGMAYDQDINCRVVGRCVAGLPLDREVGDLIPSPGTVTNRQFTYARYDLDLDRESLDRIGLTALDPRAVTKLDAVDAMDDLLAIGRAEGKCSVKPAEHFPQFLTG